MLGVCNSVHFRSVKGELRYEETITVQHYTEQHNRTPVKALVTRFCCPRYSRTSEDKPSERWVKVPRPRQAIILRTAQQRPTHTDPQGINADKTPDISRARNRPELPPLVGPEVC